MKLKYFFLSLFISVSLGSFAQKKANEYKFHSINNVMLINGESQVSGGLQSINGFQKGNWFAGAGIGLDYYVHRSIPLFADIRYEYGKKKNKFFAYGDAGLNFVWVQDQYDNDVIIWDGGNSSTDFHNGVYTELGFGYIVGTKKGNGLVLSLGHSYKSLEKTVTYKDWRTQEPITDTYQYKLNRIMIKIGWRF